MNNIPKSLLVGTFELPLTSMEPVTYSATIHDLEIEIVPTDGDLDDWTCRLTFLGSTVYESETTGSSGNKAFLEGLRYLGLDMIIDNLENNLSLLRHLKSCLTAEDRRSENPHRPTL